MSDKLKLIWEPKLYLVGSTELTSSDLARFLSDEGIPADKSPGHQAVMDGELIPEIAGRVCYMSFASPRPGGNASYLKHIIESGHGSVLEHSNWNFIVTGVSRSFSHELVRHRVGFSYSQLSQRYVDEGDTAFVVPPALIDEVREYQNYASDVSDVRGPLSRSAHAGWRWQHKMLLSLEDYRFESDYLNQKYSHIEDKTARRKAAREAARSVLPNATETKIFFTANARSLRHFIELRSSAMADAEIRRFALLLLKTMQSETPNIFGDYAIYNDDAGIETSRTDHRKV